MGVTGVHVVPPTFATQAPPPNLLHGSTVKADELCLLLRCDLSNGGRTGARLLPCLRLGTLDGLGEGGKVGGGD